MGHYFNIRCQAKIFKLQVWITYAHAKTGHFNMDIPASLSAITTAALGSLVASLTGEGDSFVGEVVDGTAAFSTSVGDLSQILAFFSAGC